MSFFCDDNYRIHVVFFFVYKIKRCARNKHKFFINVVVFFSIADLRAKHHIDRYMRALLEDILQRVASEPQQQRWRSANSIDRARTHREIKCDLPTFDCNNLSRRRTDMRDLLLSM